MAETAILTRHLTAAAVVALLRSAALVALEMAELEALAQPLLLPEHL
jgi:hypothetical protein